MTAPLLATAVALAIGLPILALGEGIRGRKERFLGAATPAPATPKNPEGSMSRYEFFDRMAQDQRSLVAAYRRQSWEGGGRILLEGGSFEIDSIALPDLDPRVELYLGDGARLEVREGLTPNVHLTLPEEYVEALDREPTGPGEPRRLYWSSPTPPHGLDDPSQNPYGYGDMTLYIPESLEPSYRERGFPDYGVPSRRYLEIWDYEPPSAAVHTSQETPSEEEEAVESPDHYTWLGQSLAALGLSDAANVESWDVLDAAFPQDPLLWTCGKYLMRQGRKGGEGKRLEDLRKARAYLNRRIAQLARGGE